MKKFALLLIVATFTSSFVSAKPSLQRNSNLLSVLRGSRELSLDHLIREGRQLGEDFPWQELGQTVGSFLINSLSDEAFLYLTSFLTMSNDLLRSADEYLDMSELALSAVGQLMRLFGARDERTARQLLFSDDAVLMLASMTGASLDDVFDAWRMISDALGAAEARQGLATIRSTIFTITGQLNSLLRIIRDVANEGTRVLTRVSEMVQTSRTPGFARQMENTLSTMNNMVSHAATSMSRLVGEFGQDAGHLYEAFSRLFTDLMDNWNAAYEAGSIRLGESTYNIFDYIGDGLRAVLSEFVNQIGMQTALKRLRTLMEDLSQLQQLTTAYQATMASEMSTFTGAVSAAQVSSTSQEMDNVFSSVSHLLRSVGVIVRETAGFAEGFTNLLSRSLDDMHRLESDFTRSWIEWFPVEWGFDGDLSGWYNAGRLVAAISRQLAQLQDAADQVSEGLRVGSGFMTDVAGVASAIDPATIEGVRAFFG